LPVSQQFAEGHGQSRRRKRFIIVWLGRVNSRPVVPQEPFVATFASHQAPPAGP
jgi:hypothetical protein